MFKNPKYLEVVKNNFKNFNAPRVICNHLLGENHTHGHRMFVGLIMITIGVAVSKVGEGFVHFLMDGLGYMIHGIGTVPFIERLMFFKSESNELKK